MRRVKATAAWITRVTLFWIDGYVALKMMLLDDPPEYRVMTPGTIHALMSTREETLPPLPPSQKMK